MSLKTELFGKFILLDKIAMGGMAEIYRAKAPGAEGIGKIIALKRILPQYTANTDFIEMFKGEAKIAVNLTQGNIAQIYEFGEEHRQFYLAMEFIDGRNLRQVLSRCAKHQRALTIEQCVFIMAQVANGLDYAHRCTDKNTGRPLVIIHRDMSPQNIMISFEGEIKIVDFGIAKAESKIENTRAGTLKGKFGYMSPEQAEGMELDARTDIFSTGIVLWELLSGERLFVASNEVNTIRKIKECHIPSLRKINPNIHEELERVTNKALAKDRSLRYQTAADLYRDLSRFLYKINPEFTQHELCLFVKTLFKEDILEDRKKVGEFAKINFPNSSKEDRTNPMSELSKSVTEASSTDKKESLLEKSGAEKTHSDEETGPPPKNVIIESQIDKDVNFSIKVDRVDLARRMLQINQSTTTGPGTRPSPLTPPRHGPLSPNTTTSFSQSWVGAKVNAWLTWLPVVLFTVGIGIAGYDFLQNPGRWFKMGSEMLGSSSVPDATQPGTPKAAETEMVHILVHSIPAGALIEVDGRPMGTTPAEITVPMLKKVVLSLKREGYIPYNKDYIGTKSPDDFPATLQKASVGYLDIDVVPPNADIYINDQKLSEKSPVRRYSVPAGQTIKIKAINSYYNTSDQATVVLKQDTLRSVRLFLRKSKSLDRTSDP